MAGDLDFNEWRNLYAARSYQDHVEFYRTAYESYPDQRHFDDISARAFFEIVAARDWTATDVAEVGGWEGELAQVILSNQANLTSWQNLEICEPAVAATKDFDGRYKAQTPDRWVWELPVDKKHTILVLSHVIEHMRAAEFEGLIKRYAKARWVFITSPLDDEPTDWSGYAGTHILEVGWNGVTEIMAEHGFVQMGEPRTKQVHCFMRPLPTKDRPRVSIVITTHNRPDLLFERAIPSVLGQSDPNWECHVVGDGTDKETVRRMRVLCKQDRRFRFTNLKKSIYPRNGIEWGLRGIEALNYGLDHAKGEWISVLADDDAYATNHNEVLIQAAVEKGVDFVYGISETPWGQRYGSYPPGDGALANGAYVYRGRARDFRYDLNCLAERGKTGDADMWERMYEGGVTFAMIDRVVHYYYPSQDH